ncbi:MAG: carbohydrate kinase [Bacteroidota bacterium]
MAKKVVCFGEILWDNFPAGPVPGGAPMNVAVRLQSLGVSASLISKVGKDEPGDQILRFIESRGVDTSLVQRDENIPTGEVQVMLDPEGIASYEITCPSAWDKILVTSESIKVVKESDAFIFGSLACRDQISEQALLEFLKHARFKVFDINLRPPFFSIALLITLVNKADFLKLNEEELDELMRMFDHTPGSLEQNILFLSEATGTKGICVTQGKDGAVLYTGNQFYRHHGFVVEVADTVGSGDSFLAALIFQILSKSSIDNALEFACAAGALVASREGANPEIKVEDIHSFSNQGSALKRAF